MNLRDFQHIHESHLIKMNLIDIFKRIDSGCEFAPAEGYAALRKLLAELRGAKAEADRVFQEKKVLLSRLDIAVDETKHVNDVRANLLTRLDNEKHDRARDVEDLRLEISRNRSIAKLAMETADQYKTKLDTAEENLSRLQAEVKKYQPKPPEKIYVECPDVAAVLRDKEILQERNGQLAAHLEAAQRDIRGYRDCLRERDTLTRELSELRDNYSTLRADKVSAENQVRALKMANEQVTKRCNYLYDQVQKRCEVIESECLRTEARRLRKEIEYRNMEITRLDSAMKESAAYLNKSRVQVSFDNNCAGAQQPQTKPNGTTPPEAQR